MIFKLTYVVGPHIGGEKKHSKTSIESHYSPKFCPSTSTSALTMSNEYYIYLDIDILK